MYLIMPQSILLSNGIVVDDVPAHLEPSYQPSIQSIHCVNNKLLVPLSLQGDISYFNIRTPTTDELDTCKKINTNEADWDQHSPSFHEQESNAEKIHNLNEYNPYGRYIYSCNRFQQTNATIIEPTLAKSHKH